MPQPNDETAIEPPALLGDYGYFYMEKYVSGRIGVDEFWKSGYRSALSGLTLFELVNEYDKTNLEDCLRLSAERLRLKDLI